MPIKSLVLAFTFALALSVGAVAAEPVLGRPAPPLVGPTLSGQAFNLAALRGRVVVVNAWATWCGPCREEMPELDAFYHRYAARGVVVVGLSIDRPSAQPMAQRIMSAYSYPAVMAATARVNGFGIPPSVPATVVLGPDGVVRTIFTGENGLLTENVLTALVEPLLPRSTRRP